MKLTVKRIVSFFTVCLFLIFSASCAAKNVESDPVSKVTKVFSSSCEALSIKTLCSDYPIIVRGKIVSIGNTVDPGIDVGTGSLVYGSAIKTEYFIEVSEVFKGKTKSGNTISVWAEGGETDMTILMPMEGKMPEIGEEWFFFIDSSNFYYPCGKIQKDGTVMIERFFVPEWYTETDNNFKYVPAEKVAELIRGYLGQTSTVG